MLEEIKQILENRGISPEDITPFETEPDYEFINTHSAIEQFKHNVMSFVNIGILYDVDVDGLSAGKIMSEYLRSLDIHHQFMMNDDKMHGLNDAVVGWVRASDIKYLIVVDAGSHDTKYFKILNDLGVQVLVLDHHDVGSLDLLHSHRDPNNTVIVNCYYEDSPNIYLSGAGVVYRFIKEMDKVFQVGGVERYKSWVGLSVLSDSCNILDRENRHYVQYLYENYELDPIFNKFKNYGSLETMFNFTVIPLMNSCIRMGKQEVVLELINNRHPKNIETLISEAKSVHDTQKQLVEKLMDEIKLVEGDHVVISTLPTHEYKGILGLGANKIRYKYDKAALLLVREDDSGIYRGSFRGINGVTTDELGDIGIKTIGHKKASGVFIEIDQFVDKSRRMLKLEVPKEMFKAVHELEINEDDFYEKRNILYGIAHLNEYSGVGFEKIAIKIKKLRLKPVVDTYEKVIRYRYLNFEVVDFELERDSTKQRDTKEIIVHPVLKGDTFTLVLAE